MILGEMSIDTWNDSQAVSPVEHPEPWETLRQRMRRNLRRSSSEAVFGPAGKGGSIYRWGLAVSRSSQVDAATAAISRLAVADRPDKKVRDQVDLFAATESFAQWLQTTKDVTAGDGAATAMWAAALPALVDELEPMVWLDLFESLVQFRQSYLLQHDTSSAFQLAVGAELGLTLAWRCDGHPSVRGFKASAVNELSQWCDNHRESVSESLQNPLELRLVLACLIRCKRLMLATSKRRWTKKRDRAGARLATWAIALTEPTGTSAFSSAAPKQIQDDLGRNGLLAAAVEFDPDSLRDALTAAMGKASTSGRLTWQADLPETLHHDSDAKVAVMFPDWGVRRGRTQIDYSRDEIRLDVFAGRARVLSGTWRTWIETDSGEQYADGTWSEICEYSDDDVHYLELEQAWTGGLLVQRQCMLIRDDRCLLLADSIIPQEGQHRLPDWIKYRSGLPLDPSIQLVPESETREAFLDDGRKRALVIPLSAGEWTIGRSDATIQQAGDGALAVSAAGRSRLYVPLWFDFQKRRFDRKRTWRQLTIADQLRIVRSDEAVGYRVQVGSEHWVVYRSLAERSCRSFLGNHLIADFFSARFDPEDGDHESLITVDDHES